MHPRRAALLRSARAGGCTPGEPPSCLRQGRVRGRTGRAAFLRAARAGAWPHGTSRLLAYRKGGCVAAQDEPPSCVPQGRVRGRTGQAAFLRAARAGVAPQASRLLACRKGGKPHTAARRNHANARKGHTPERQRAALSAKQNSLGLLKKGHSKAATRALRESIPTRGRRPKAACAKQSSLPSFLSRKRGKRGS